MIKAGDYFDNNTTDINARKVVIFLSDGSPTVSDTADSPEVYAQNESNIFHTSHPNSAYSVYSI